jgi:hypothetical protein
MAYDHLLFGVADLSSVGECFGSDCNAGQEAVAATRG